MTLLTPTKVNGNTSSVVRAAPDVEFSLDVFGVRIVTLRSDELLPWAQVKKVEYELEAKGGGKAGK